MRVTVTGREGQIARALLERAPSHDVALTAIGRPDFDLASPATVAAAIEAARPHVIVNAAAYTAVDKAESEPGLALAVNAAGAGAVAAAAARLRVPVVQISTDYVFDGTADRPYEEDDPTAPLGAYGRSKLAGEEAVAHATPNHAILRTAWVYSPFGANFVKTMLRLAASRGEVAVVADQWGCPSAALDIADAILAVARNLVANPQNAGLRGVFHLAGTGDTTWAEFATSIFGASKEFGGSTARVRPIATSEYPTPARRPSNSRLACGKLARVHGVVLPPWQDSTRACVGRLIKEAAA